MSLFISKHNQNVYTPSCCIKTPQVKILWWPSLTRPMYKNSRSIYIPAFFPSVQTLDMTLSLLTRDKFPSNAVRKQVGHIAELEVKPQSYNSHSAIETRNNNLGFSYYSRYLGNCHFIWHISKCKSWNK